MNWTAALLFATCLQVSAAGYSQGRITLSLKNAPLQKVFTAIKSQSGYTVWYDMAILKNTTPVDIDVKDVSLEKALTIACHDQPLEFSITDRMIVIKAKADKPGNDPPEKIDVKGRVLNEKGEPAPGISVTIKDSHIGTMTDEDGRFELSNIDKSAVLLFSGANIETTEEPLNGRIELVIVVKIRIGRLDDVQIIGYGTTTKRYNTGNVSSLKSDVIEQQPISNPIEAIAGRMPGVFIQQQSGLTGANFIIQIRGQNSLAAGNFPLYIVDGVPFTAANTGDAGSLNQFQNYGIAPQSPLNSINPDDIERIDILKDAVATAIYGSRGSNGVILITTKKGKPGKTRLELRGYTGAGVITRRIPLLNRSQYLTMRREAFTNDGLVPNINTAPDLVSWDTTRNTDWQKFFIGNRASTVNAEATLSGGDAHTQFLLGAGYLSQRSVFPGNKADQRSSVHLQVLHNSSNEKLSAQISATYSGDKNELPDQDPTNYIDLPPVAPALFDGAGKLNWANNTFYNPYSYILQPYTGKTMHINSNGVFKYRILPGLEVKADMGYTYMRMDQVILEPKSAFNPVNNPQSASLFGNKAVETWIVEPQISYGKIIGRLSVNLMAGSTWEEDVTDGYTLRASNFPNDALLQSLSSAGSVTTIQSNHSLYRYQAIFGRLQLKWSEELLLNITGRRDGSSRFGPGRQFAIFGAAGGGWIFSEQPWFKQHARWLSFGKLRVSYGMSGNDQIGDYAFLDTYTTSTYAFDNEAGLIPARLYNPDYSWEISRKLETTVEWALLKNRIMISLAWYRNRSSSQLVSSPLPGQTGFTSMQANLPALIQNSGWEMELNFVNIRSNHFQWTTNINLTVPQNKLISFPGLENSAYAHRFVEGKPLTIRETFHFTGVDPKTGVFTFEDVNKDGQQFSYPGDLTSYKKNGYDFYGGITNSLQYKQWEANFLFQFVRQTGSNYMAYLSTPPGGMKNFPDYILNRWQKPGDQATMQRFTSTTSNAYIAWIYGWVYGADNTLSDASFIRLKNLSISYTISKELANKIHMNSVRIFIQCQNLLTITDYLGGDPESKNYHALPLIRQVTAGGKFTF